MRTTTDQVIAVIAQLSAFDERAQERVLNWLAAHLDVVRAEKTAKRQVKMAEKKGGDG